jgi:hypothetical protein
MRINETLRRNPNIVPKIKIETLSGSDFSSITAGGSIYSKT